MTPSTATQWQAPVRPDRGREAVQLGRQRATVDAAAPAPTAVDVDSLDDGDLQELVDRVADALADRVAETLDRRARPGAAGVF